MMTLKTRPARALLPWYLVLGACGATELHAASAQDLPPTDEVTLRKAEVEVPESTGPDVLVSASVDAPPLRSDVPEPVDLTGSDGEPDANDVVGLEDAEDVGEPPSDLSPGQPDLDPGTPDLPAASPCTTVYRGAKIAGASDVAWDVCVAEGRITGVAPSGSLPGGSVVDFSGRWLAPAVIDSHVHVVYYPAAESLVAGGVIAAVDHAAPGAFFTTDFGPLLVIGAGPMITATLGYPTQSWGADGYGHEVPVGDVPAAEAAVDTLVGMGALLIKVPLEQGPQLTDAQLLAIVTRAHALGRKVSVHALSDAGAARAATAGADVLAHVPTAPLLDATVAAWASRTVITTLSAFGGGAVDNLKRLRAAGARVLYGTDFGNTTVLGPSAAEIAQMVLAGMDGAAILESMTVTPAAYWPFEGLGAIAVGRRAAFLVLDRDPLTDPSAIAQPVEVITP